jgi:copper homeostasis protein
MKIIEQLIGLGVSRVLTSGGMHTALQGIHQIKTMQKTFGDDIVIMPGSGINTANVNTILQETGVSEIHMSAKSNHYSEMIVSDSNGRLHSPLLQMNDWWWHDVDPAEINEVARIIKNSS